MNGDALVESSRRPAPVFERREAVGALDATIVGSLDNAAVIFILLHGYAMSAADLSPFLHSIGMPVASILPEGILPAAPAGRAWWPIDQERRVAALRTGPRDLVDEYSPGRADARARLDLLVTALRPRLGDRPLILGGFSQGGMLACDYVLMRPASVAGLVLLSASRIARVDWEARMQQLRNLPVLVSHGRDDPDLAFAAGEGLRDQLRGGGADVTWVPFDGGHSTPLPVWREIRKFLKRRVEHARGQ